jgi:hypothetical protein
MTSDDYWRDVEKSIDAQVGEVVSDDGISSEGIPWETPMYLPERTPVRQRTPCLPEGAPMYLPRGAPTYLPEEFRFYEREVAPGIPASTVHRVANSSFQLGIWWACIVVLHAIVWLLIWLFTV